jgi:hypothetical protein
MASEFSLPSLPVDLPSRGKLYPKENPLSSGVVELKYMTCFEEDILTNDIYIQKGEALDRFMKSMVVSKIDFDTLVIGDKDQIMVAARILGFGKDYHVTYEGKPVTINLSELKDKEIDWSLIQEGKNEFDFVLPHSQVKVTFKIPTHKDERIIQAEIDGLAKQSPDLKKNSSTKLYHQIIAVNGNRDTKVIRDFVDKGLITLDSRPLRAYMEKVSPGVDFKTKGVTSTGEVVEGLTMPMTVEFFWPRS